MLNNHIHFIGIKGSGMASLANICLDLGYSVTGSDVEQFIFTETELLNRGVKITPFNKSNIKDHSLVIIGASFNDTNEEVIAAKNNSTVKWTYYYTYLSELISKYDSICVAGSHGKTTTTGMVQNLLKGFSPTGFLIGEGHGHLNPEDTYFVVESCEYKDHFLNYFPNYSIITNIDLDHVDYFKDIDQYVDSFQKFINQTKKGIVLNADDPYTPRLKTNLPVITFGIKNNATLVAKNIQTHPDGTSFDVYHLGEFISSSHIPSFGIHNVYNSLAALGLGLFFNFDLIKMIKQISLFEGVSRRFVVENYNHHVFIDDYAHHPTEIKTTIDAARRLFHDKKIVVIYKPDRVSRIKYFESEFKASLLTADKSYVLDFPSSAYLEDPSYSLEKFLNAMGNEIIYLPDNQEGIEKLAREKEAVYIFVSPKDIYKFKDKLKKEFNY